ncbi:MAG: SAM-dependent methyltransferase, partial [Muribaculaceae bacterium]
MNNLINQIRGISYCEANSIIHRLSGIVDYFTSEQEMAEFISTNENFAQTVSEDRVSYGDWQTPKPLAEKVCRMHTEKYGNPDIVIEPTCGLGSFVHSALSLFTNVKEIHAIEINRLYTNELKLNLLLNSLKTPGRKHPDIYIYHGNFFGFNFSPIINKAKQNNWNLAIVGNPPWVTNSKQGKNNSQNIPLKSNVYGLKGIDAITGKSNFDISEYITLHLLMLSQNNHGGISFLLKNSVIRNILLKQHSENIRIGDIEQRVIDASSEFNVSVDASCFFAKFDCPSAFICNVKDFYTDKYIQEYGWVDGAFVSDTKSYREYSKYDKSSTYVWRSGIKHDCAHILELTLKDGVFINGFGETVQIEDDLIFPLLKSSDIRGFHNNQFRKFIIVPQRNVGDDTSILKNTHPLAYSYLTKYEATFQNRKSSIYNGKDKFSIFGIGDYSFSPYKIVISSLYKTICFQLVSPFNGKPVMVDDTCYQLDFENIEEAKCI